jgi:hypothetical protein
MKLGAIGIEGAGEELAPKGAEFGEVTRLVAAHAGRGGQGVRNNGRHDESCLFPATSVAWDALFSALTGSFGR